MSKNRRETDIDKEIWLMTAPESELVKALKSLCAAQKDVDAMEHADNLAKAIRRQTMRIVDQLRGIRAVEKRLGS